jgi:hypothetical protein
MASRHQKTLSPLKIPILGRFVVKMAVDHDGRTEINAT